MCLNVARVIEPAQYVVCTVCDMRYTQLLMPMPRVSRKTVKPGSRLQGCTNQSNTCKRTGLGQSLEAKRFPAVLCWPDHKSDCSLPYLSTYNYAIV